MDFTSILLIIYHYIIIKTLFENYTLNLRDRDNLRTKTKDPFPKCPLFGGSTVCAILKRKPCNFNGSKSRMVMECGWLFQLAFHLLGTTRVSQQSSDAMYNRTL